jgi:copper chaperone CopZ
VVVQRVAGVREATFSYEKGEGFVTYDTTQTSPEAFIAALESMTDYRAKVRDEEPRPNRSP